MLPVFHESCHASFIVLLSQLALTGLRASDLCVEGAESHERADGETGDCADSARGAQDAHTGHIVAAEGRHSKPEGSRVPRSLSGLFSGCDQGEILVSIDATVVVVLEDMLVELLDGHVAKEHALAGFGVHIALVVSIIISLYKYLQFT